MWLSWIQYHTHILINRRVHPHGFWLSRPQKGSRLGRKQINTVTPLQPGPFSNQMTDKSPNFRLQITLQNSKKKTFLQGKIRPRALLNTAAITLVQQCQPPCQQRQTWGLCWEAAPAKRISLRPKPSPFLHLQHWGSAPNAQNSETKMQRWVQSQGGRAGAGPARMLNSPALFTESEKTSALEGTSKFDHSTDRGEGCGTCRAALQCASSGDGSGLQISGKSCHSIWDKKMFDKTTQPSVALSQFELHWMYSPTGIITIWSYWHCFGATTSQ